MVRIFRDLLYGIANFTHLRHIRHILALMVVIVCFDLSTSPTTICDVM